MNNIELADYSGFETLDFFTDENFIRYVLHPGESDLSFWQAFLSKHPEKREATEEAAAWIRQLNTQALYEPATPMTDSWSNVSARIAAHEQRQAAYIIPLKRAAKWISGAAAILLLYFAVTEFIQLGQQRFKTEYAELRSVTFPDESVAILNANSQVYYNRDWRSDKPRELWLEGEASFKVKHVAVMNRFQEADSFKVHVNGLELTVLGTTFNVKDRRGETEISLINGSLRIDKKDGAAFSKMMKPGDVYRYDGHRLLKTDQLRAAKASQSWTRKELELEGYTLQDVLHVLEDNYGYKVHMNAPELSGKRLSGIIPLTSDKDIFFVMEKVFKVNVTQKDKELFVNKPKGD